MKNIEYSLKLYSEHLLVPTLNIINIIPTLVKTDILFTHF